MVTATSAQTLSLSERSHTDFSLPQIDWWGFANNHLVQYKCRQTVKHFAVSVSRPTQTSPSVTCLLTGTRLGDCQSVVATTSLFPEDFLTDFWIRKFWLATDLRFSPVYHSEIHMIANWLRAIANLMCLDAPKFLCGQQLTARGCRPGPHLPSALGFLWSNDLLENIDSTFWLIFKTFPGNSLG